MNSTGRTNPPSKDPAANEEPEPAAEESVPLDGKDRVGEKMMEELGRERKDDKGRDGPGRSA